MITVAHQNQILEFLVSKKLPADLIIELKDHFAVIVLNEMNDRGITFEEGFLNAKAIWEKDLAMKRRGLLSFEKLPAIAIAYQQHENQSLLRNSFLIMVCLLAFHLLGTKTLAKEYYFILNSGLYMLMTFLLPLLAFLNYCRLYFKIFFVHQAEKFYKTRIPVLTFLVLFTMMSAIQDLPTNSFKIAYDFLNFEAFEFQVFAVSVFKLALNYFTFTYLYLIMKRRVKESVKFRKVINL